MLITGLNDQGHIHDLALIVFTNCGASQTPRSKRREMSPFLLHSPSSRLNLGFGVGCLFVTQSQIFCSYLSLRDNPDDSLKSLEVGYSV